ncbi:hypothetical protein [Vibrio diabolicus]|uniref:hypothetical protein n=1 Tax=Vibrio diabolicus TaxID=50719 RepID=UPI0030B8FC65
MEPTYVPSKALNAISGAMPKVRGMSSAIPIVAVKPGNMPNQITSMTPKKLATKAIGSRAPEKKSIFFSLRKHYTKYMGK